VSPKLNGELIFRAFLSIQTLVSNKQYALRPHAVTHMLSEGFEEKDTIESIGNGKIIEDYYEEDRCLISGKFQLTEKTYENIHEEEAWVKP